MNLATVDDQFNRMFRDQDERNQWIQRKECELLDEYLKDPRRISLALQQIVLKDNASLTCAVIVRDKAELGRLMYDRLRDELSGAAFNDALDAYDMEH